MIGKVVRGEHVAGLLAYLFGPGRANEHTDPRLVASWDGRPDTLQPAWRDVIHPGGTVTTRPDTRPLAAMLQQPVTASLRTPNKPVWHCSLRAAFNDRRLTDQEWADVAREVVTRTSFAPDGDDGSCRWVAVRHADDHVHLVVTLARQDGGRVSSSNDFYRLGEACREAEKRLGLTATAGRDRTAAKRPSRGETEKAKRRGRPEPARVVLAREVRAAAAGADGPREFLARLADSGVLVRLRHSVRDPQAITGYAVAVPDEVTTAGQHIWYAGGRLAADLTWSKLSTTWRTTRHEATPGTARCPVPRWPDRLTGAARAAAWRDASQVAADATVAVTGLARTDPRAAADLAHAAGQVLAATARVVEGRQGGPLTRAADAYDRAARDLHGRLPTRHHQGANLRAVARLVAMTGRARRDEATQVLALVTHLVALVDAVSELRHAQDRLAQASAARSAAVHLRVAAAASPAAPAYPERAGIHSPRVSALVHGSGARQPPEPSRRTSLRP